MPQMTKLEIIEELFDNHFVKNPKKRGMTIGGTSCVYYNPDTRNKCAVGMCLTTKALSRIGRATFSGGVTQLDKMFNNDLDSAMKPQYRGHENAFWMSLQQLHDDDYYWFDNHFTAYGEERLAELKTAYSNN
jgi:hypothetical protein